MSVGTPDQEVSILDAQRASDLPEYQLGDTRESRLSSVPEPGVGSKPRRLEQLTEGQASLVVSNGRLAGTTYRLPEKAVVGRHPSSDIFLNDITVSRKHAQFHRLGSRYWITDLGSLNGSYVNRERVEETALSSGDEVQIGKFRFVFLAR
jgi:pSer/pThr/pTyr-binding forkhead associated (FHA) protein